MRKLGFIIRLHPSDILTQKPKCDVVVGVYQSVSQIKLEIKIFEGFSILYISYIAERE